MAENDAVRIGLWRFLFWYLAQPYSVLSVHVNAQPRAREIAQSHATHKRTTPGPEISVHRKGVVHRKYLGLRRSDRRSWCDMGAFAQLVRGHEPVLPLRSDQPPSPSIVEHDLEHTVHTTSYRRDGRVHARRQKHEPPSAIPRWVQWVRRVDLSPGSFRLKWV